MGRNARILTTDYTDFVLATEHTEDTEKAKNSMMKTLLQIMPLAMKSGKSMLLFYRGHTEVFAYLCRQDINDFIIPGDGGSLI